MVLPSADLPHLLSLMRLTIAARSSAQSFSHSAMDAGSFAGPAVVPVAAVVDEPPWAAAVVAVVSLLALSSLSSPPHAAIVAIIASATAVDTANRRFPLMRPPSVTVDADTSVEPVGSVT